METQLVLMSGLFSLDEEEFTAVCPLKLSYLKSDATCSSWGLVEEKHFLDVYLCVQDRILRVHTLHVLCY